jgi:branched-chain amino acid transport system ATP-binding protein
LPWCRRGGAVSVIVSVEENLLIGTYGRKTGGYWNAGNGLRPVPDPQGTPQQSRHRAFGRTAADGGHRPRADEQSAVLLCDEISLGLAPVVIKRHLQGGSEDPEAGASLIVVEQDIGQAMAGR